MVSFIYQYSYIFIEIIFVVDILTHCENDLLNSDLFGDETMAQLQEPLPLDLMDNVKPNNFLNPSLLSPNNGFESPVVSTRNTAYANVSPHNNNNPVSNSAYSPIHSQPVPNNPPIQNVQVKNVSLPVQNPTAVIISSPSMQHNSQPLVYTSLPVENQHIILQQGNVKSQSNSQKNAPVILQNIQQPVLLQAKLIKSDSQVS